MEQKKGYCFTAIVGQEDMKTALILNVINPGLGGVLIRGEKGTAKSREEVKGCRFGCDPADEAHLCDECRERLEKGEELETVYRPMRVIDLPVSATEDRVVGTLDMEYAIRTGRKKFEEGILARANRNILYVDEINLLDDHVVDVLLDSAAMGVNTVEREGVSYSHPAAFILAGTMNPEEGDLRPQLIDRFGLSVTVAGEHDVRRRVEVLRNRLKYENDPEGFAKEYAPKQQELRERILAAQEGMSRVSYSQEIMELIARICIQLEVDGHRADIMMLKTAMTLAAYNGKTRVEKEEVMQAARLVLPHRMRRKPFEEAGFDLSLVEEMLN